tara:strand:- start:2473 stop:2646 length:174 start_codon:yes stop_codon:yes gene_type:complete
MTRNKLIQFAIALEELRIRDKETPTNIIDENIYIENNINNRFEYEKQNPYFEDEANI